MDELISIHKTFEEMFADRGYSFYGYNLQEELPSIEYEMDKLKSDKSLSKFFRDVNGGIVLFYWNIGDFCIQNASDIIEMVNGDSIPYCIVTYNPDGKGKSFIPLIKGMGSATSFEFLDMSNFIANVTRHCLVPTHIKMDDEQRKELLRRYKKFSIFPKMLSTDPIAVYYGYKPGDVVMIIRKQSSLPFFRVVV